MVKADVVCYMYVCAEEPCYIGGAKDPADPSLVGEVALDTRCTIGEDIHEEEIQVAGEGGESYVQKAICKRGADTVTWRTNGHDMMTCSPANAAEMFGGGTYADGPSTGSIKQTCKVAEDNVCKSKANSKDLNTCAECDDTSVGSAVAAIACTVELQPQGQIKDASGIVFAKFTAIRTIDKQPGETTMGLKCGHKEQLGCASEKTAGETYVCTQVCKIKEAMCCKNVSELVVTLLKSLDRQLGNDDAVESPTAEGDLVSGMVKVVCNLGP